jgi:hypothetical protein
MSQEFYTTGDNYIAAYLIVKRVPFRGAFTTEDKKHVQYRFADSPAVQDHLLDFTYGAEVPAKDFVEAHKFIWAQARKARNNGGA